MNRTANRFTPKLESLDDRIVPSCTWTLEGGVLTVVGSQRADIVNVQDNGTTLTVTCDGEALDLPDAKLDDGDMWATEFAVIKLTPAVEKRIAELIKKAAG